MMPVSVRLNHAISDGFLVANVYRLLEKVMGKIFVTDPVSPVSAMAYVGCFAFYAGVPDKELVMHKPDGYELKYIDENIYDQFLTDSVTRDFVSSFIKKGEVNRIPSRIRIKKTSYLWRLEVFRWRN